MMNVMPSQSNYRYQTEMGNSYGKLETDLEYDEITVEYVIMTRFELK